MTKKERRSLKKFATSNEWIVTREEVKRSFVRTFLNEHKEYKEKDKKLVREILLGVSF